MTRDPQKMQAQGRTDSLWIGPVPVEGELGHGCRSLSTLLHSRGETMSSSQPLWDKQRACWAFRDICQELTSLTPHLSNLLRWYRSSENRIWLQGKCLCKELPSLLFRKMLPSSSFKGVGKEFFLFANQ